MLDPRLARGRLEFLCKVAHWMCRIRDWTTVKGLYEAVLESIELGEETWNSDFSHYETMITQAREVGNKELHTKPQKMELFWCKAYQKGKCTESLPHLAIVRPDEPPVLVLDMCAIWWQKEGKRMEHPEEECGGRK